MPDRDQQAAKQTDSVFVRMQRIMQELQPIGKGKQNQEQHYKFRGIDDVLNNLQPLLAKHGVFFSPYVIEIREGTHETKSKSIWNDVKLHVQYTFFGLNGDTFLASAWGEGTDSGDKATNKAMTGAMKYMLNQVFAIPFEGIEDSDATTPPDSVSADGWRDDAKAALYEAAPTPGTNIKDNPLPDAEVPVNEIQRNRIVKLASERRVDLAAMLSMAGFESLASVPQERGQKLIDWLERQPVKDAK